VAGLDTQPLNHTPDAHDGQAVCRVCSTPAADAGHDWCSAASGLVCRTCCQRALLGDGGKLIAASAGTAPTPCDDECPGPLSACAECERGRRWFADHMLGFMTRGSTPS